MKNIIPCKTNSVARYFDAIEITKEAHLVLLFHL